MGRKISQTTNATMLKTTILTTKSPQKVEKMLQQIPPHDANLRLLPERIRRLQRSTTAASEYVMGVGSSCCCIFDRGPFIAKSK
jgi:hypothetical protein